MKNIVIIGGGTGTFTLLNGLRKYPSNNTVIVSSADDGGSTGILRKDLRVMPPGDIRQCLVGLSYTEPQMRELFNYRFQSGRLKGHAVGNIIIAALEKITGNIDEAINLSAKMLNVRGQVVPVTLKPTRLSAVLQSGETIIGEHNIDEPKGNLKLEIKNLKLVPSGPVNPKALRAIKDADVIVFGPGDLFTSILPNLLVTGAAAAINKSRAKKVLVTNIMTRFGQTDGFKVSDFVKVLERYLTGKMDAVLANNKAPSGELLKKYAKEKAVFVKPDLKNSKSLTVIAEDLISKDVIKKSSADSLKRSFLRHDSDKVAKLIWELL